MSKVDYPDEWHESIVNEVCQFIGRGVGPSYSESPTKTIAINQKCVRNGTVYTEFGRFQKEKVSVRRTSVLQTGDVCINSTGYGTIGRVGLWKKESLSYTYFVDSHVTIARPIEGKFDSKYLCELLSTDWLQNDLDRFCFTGSTNQIELSRSELLKLKLHYPELIHQQKIAKVLSTIDNQIEQTQALIEKYTAIKQGLMSDLFSRGIDINTGKLRPSYQQAPELYWKSELGWIPNGWEVSPLSALTKVLTSGSRDWGALYAEEGELFVRITNLTREHINFTWHSIKRVDVSKAAEGERSRLMKDDILISITADLGIVGVVPDSFEEAYINQHIALVRIDDPDINNRFVGHFLSTPTGRRQFEKQNDSGAKAGLNLSAVGATKLIQPNIGEQELISERLDAIDLHIEKLKQNKQKSQSQKQGLMQDLLTGKKSVDSLPDSILTSTSSSQEVAQL